MGRLLNTGLSGGLNDTESLDLEEIADELLENVRGLVTAIERYREGRGQVTDIVKGVWVPEDIQTDIFKVLLTVLKVGNRLDIDLSEEITKIIDKR